MKTLIIETQFDQAGPLQEAPGDFVEYHNEVIGVLCSTLNMDVLSISYVYVEDEHPPVEPHCISTAICLLNGQTLDSIAQSIRSGQIALPSGRKLHVSGYPAYGYSYKLKLIVSKK
jgi:hypothetical protein